MLSALAKYIFGGIMGDAPETTTPMQYETREINDWLLVDMPDQAIDDEDMDSESDDDDDILTAVPLLMSEEPMNSRQSVLLYKANAVCDNTYRKLRKDFHDKNHSASSKAQVHSGDKIQGNFVEAISIEIEDNFHSNIQDNSTGVKENSKLKSKKSRSKKSKSKRSKKSKIQNNFNGKIRDISVSVKGNCNDDIQEKSNDNIQQDFDDTIPSLCEIPDNSIDETKNVYTANLHNSKNRKQVVSDKFHENCENEIEENSDEKLQKDSDNKFQSDCSVVPDDSGNKIKDGFVDKSEVIPISVIQKYHDTSLNVNDSVVEDLLDKSDKTCDDVVQEDLYNKTQSVILEAQNGFDRKMKRLITVDPLVEELFEEIERKRNDDIQKHSDNQAKLTFSGKKQNIFTEFKGNFKNSRPKKYRSKNSKKSRIQNRSDVTLQDIYVGVQEKYNDDFQESAHNIVVEDFNKEIQSITSEVSNDLKGEILNQLATESKDVCDAVHKNYADEVQENPEKDIQESFDDKTEPVPSKVQFNTCNTIQDTVDEIEAVSLAVIEKSKDSIQDMTDDEIQNICNTALKNYSEFRKNSNEVQEVFTDEIKSIALEAQNHDAENQSNSIDNTENVPVEQDNFQNKNQNISLEFQENSNDGYLDSFANFWDIYTEITDDEVQQILGSELNEKFNELINESFHERVDSDGEMNESSNDEEATDDEMNENSGIETKDFSDDEMYQRPRGSVIDNLLGAALPCKSDFRFSYPEESEDDESEEDEESEEESDDGLFPDIRNYNFSSTKECTKRQAQLEQECYKLFEDFKQNTTEVSKPNTACLPYTEYELAEYFNVDSGYVYASQSLHYTTSYALTVAELFAIRERSYQGSRRHPCYSENCNILSQKYKRRQVTEKPSSPDPIDPSLITNSAELLQNIINQKSIVLPTKTAVVLEHVKDLKPVQQAIQFETRKYLTRSQLNRQNRNYIYQSSVKTNRRRNLQRNPSGANNNRKCC